MIWFVVWAVLVIAALVVIGWLLRRLWRQAVALGRELSAASLVLSRLADQVEALAAAADRDPHRTDPSLFAELDELRDQLAQVRASRDGRRAERASKAARTSEGWRAYWT